MNSDSQSTDDGVEAEQTYPVVGTVENVPTADALERVIVLVSAILITVMLGYVAWQAVATSEVVDPDATVVEVQPTTDGDRLRVTVRLANEGGTGLSSAKVAVQCGTEVRSLTFEHVPAGGQQTGTVVCPAGTTPEAAVDTWMGA